VGRLVPQFATAVTVIARTPQRPEVHSILTQSVRHLRIVMRSPHRRPITYRSLARTHTGPFKPSDSVASWPQPWERLDLLLLPWNLGNALQDTPIGELSSSFGNDAPASDHPCEYAPMES